ncbi:HAD-IIIA family hydrolase [Butyrivibrio sp. AE2015]|uniref:HAD-IIIA family hydrolase n=1 Tax=Butyrivibrio sp. AE2015 TaxID=1280663 RepID=UPI0003B2EE96|nr:HAD-IIIA family hydrolase [Butyrivibrio sp. AE2015]
MKTVIMAGGKGTRISDLFPNIPKPLIEIKNRDGVSKPILQWEIESLRDQGFKEIILTVSHMHEKIQDYFGDGSKFGCHIEYFVEEQPLGNAGALFKMREKLQAPFLLLIADAMFDVDFNRMINYHKEHNALATLFTHPNSHPFDSSVIVANSNGAVEQWLTKEDIRPEFYKNRVNAGLQIIDPIVLDMTLNRLNMKAEDIGTVDDYGYTIKMDMDRQILKPLCDSGRMYCYDSPEYCKDMGTPERFNQVSMDFQNGVVQAKNLLHPQKAIFLDRDGTINKHIGFLRKPEELELCDGAAEAIKKINGSGYLAIVITNQPVIARGEVTFEGLEEIHKKLETELGKAGAYIDGLYYCPHHPDKGFEGEVTELKIVCDCRKPRPGLILQAAKDFNIDLEQSWMIGDSNNDVGAGKNAGCRTALIGDEDLRQNITGKSLLDVVEQIIGR